MLDLVYIGISLMKTDTCSYVYIPQNCDRLFYCWKATVNVELEGYNCKEQIKAYILQMFGRHKVKVS